MKEATGELSMVVVTILAIALIAGVVKFLVPLAQEYVGDQWKSITDESKKTDTPTNPKKP